MPRWPLPGSTGGSARTPAASQPAPGSTGGTPRTPAASQPAPGSTGGTPRSPASLSAQAVPHGARKIPILVNWWLEKVEGEEGKIRVAGHTYTPQMMSPLLRKLGKKNLARRVFRSKAIVKRHDQTTIESEDGYHIKIGSLLNADKTRENGFSEKVCVCFEFGFQELWQEVINPKMVPDNEHAQSPSETTTGAPSRSVEDWVAYFMSDSFSSKRSTENNFDSFVGYSGNTDGLTTENSCNFPDDSIDCTSSQLGEPGNSKSGKDSVNLGTTDEVELTTEVMTPKFGAIRGSEESTGSRLRSGEVPEIPNRGPMERGHKQKKIQLAASSKQMVKQGATSTVDLTSHESVFSAAEVVDEEKLESHDSCRRGRGRPRKGDKRKRESGFQSTNWN